MSMKKKTEITNAGEDAEERVPSCRCRWKPVSHGGKQDGGPPKTGSPHVTKQPHVWVYVLRERKSLS